MRCFLAALLVGALIEHGLADDKAPVGLATYVGRDLRKLDDAGIAAFWQAFYAFTSDPPEEKKKYESYEPWHVVEFRAGAAQWMFVEVYPCYEIPGYSLARVHAFDKSWNRLALNAFPTGYRMSVKEVQIKPSTELKQDLLVIKIVSTLSFLQLQDGGQQPNQEEFQLQHYALLGSGMALVRLEDDKNRLVRNYYGLRIPLRGGKIPQRSKDEWINTLSSGPPADQLATLVWLSGRHLKSTQPRSPKSNQESVEHSELFEGVRDSPQTKDALNRLHSSEVSWVKEYAKLALASADD